MQPMEGWVVRRQIGQHRSSAQRVFARVADHKLMWYESDTAKEPLGGVHLVGRYVVPVDGGDTCTGKLPDEASTLHKHMKPQFLLMDTANNSTNYEMQCLASDNTPYKDFTKMVTSGGTVGPGQSCQPPTAMSAKVAHVYNVLDRLCVLAATFPEALLPSTPFRNEYMERRTDGLEPNPDKAAEAHAIELAEDLISNLIDTFKMPEDPAGARLVTVVKRIAVNLGFFHIMANFLNVEIESVARVAAFATSRMTVLSIETTELAGPLMPTVLHRINADVDAMVPGPKYWFIVNLIKAPTMMQQLLAVGLPSWCVRLLRRCWKVLGHPRDTLDTPDGYLPEVDKETAQEYRHREGYATMCVLQMLVHGEHVWEALELSGVKEALLPYAINRKRGFLHTSFCFPAFIDETQSDEDIIKFLLGPTPVFSTQAYKYKPDADTSTLTAIMQRFGLACRRLPESSLPIYKNKEGEEQAPTSVSTSFKGSKDKEGNEDTGDKETTEGTEGQDGTDTKVKKGTEDAGVNEETKDTPKDEKKDMKKDEKEKEEKGGSINRFYDVAEIAPGLVRAARIDELLTRMLDYPNLFADCFEGLSLLKHLPDVMAQFNSQQHILSVLNSVSFCPRGKSLLREVDNAFDILVDVATDRKDKAVQSGSGGPCKMVEQFVGDYSQIPAHAKMEFFKEVTSLLFRIFPERAHELKLEYADPRLSTPSMGAATKPSSKSKGHKHKHVVKPARSSLIEKRSSSIKRTGLGPGIQRFDSATSSSDDDDEEHCMISYCWDDQPFVLRLAEALRLRGIKVWVDVDNMSGSTLEAMAMAVENAYTVIVVLSEAYKNSTACRTEAEYAYTLKKTMIPVKNNEEFNASGWLGALMGTKLWFSFGGLARSQFESKMDALILELERVSRREQPVRRASSLDMVSKRSSLASAPTSPDYGAGSGGGSGGGADNGGVDLGRRIHPNGSDGGGYAVDHSNSSSPSPTVAAALRSGTGDEHRKSQVAWQTATHAVLRGHAPIDLHELENAVHHAVSVKLRELFSVVAHNDDNGAPASTEAASVPRSHSEPSPAAATSNTTDTADNAVNTTPGGTKSSDDASTTSTSV
eukprot:m.99120 g.99120  ORF g.99120 m.99120 type:complete len:1093 (+) comp10296_c1_seq1:67-3345(+)